MTPSTRRAFDRVYHRKFIDKIGALFQAGVQTGELKSLDPGVAVWALLGIMYPYFYPSHTDEMPPPTEVLDQILTIYLDGILM